MMESHLNRTWIFNDGGKRAAEAMMGSNQVQDQFTVRLVELSEECSVGLGEADGEEFMATAFGVL